MHKPDTRECPECAGTGKEPCTECQGDGFCNHCLTGECPECHGEQELDCEWCNGTGTEEY